MKENYTYPAAIERLEGEITLTFLDFPNYMASGETMEEAVQSAQEVLALAILDYVDTGRELPKPQEILQNNVIYINIWMPYYKKNVKVVYVRKSVTIPAWIDELAKDSGINFSAALVRGIKEELGINK